MSKRELDKLTSEVKNLSVASCADGSMRIDIEWFQKPLEPGATPVGFITRMWAAEKIEEILKAAMWNEKHGKR